MNFDIKIRTPRGVYKGGTGLSQYFGPIFNKFENIIGEPEMDKMADILVQSNKDNISNQRKANGSPLGDWTDSTRKARVRSTYPLRKLFKTGEMFDSIGKEKTGKLSRRIESKAPHSGYVQYARSGKWTFFGVGKPAMSELQKYLTELLRTKLRNAH